MGSFRIPYTSFAQVTQFSNSLVLLCHHSIAVLFSLKHFQFSNPYDPTGKKNIFPCFPQPECIISPPLSVTLAKKQSRNNGNLCDFFLNVLGLNCVTARVSFTLSFLKAEKRHSIFSAESIPTANRIFQGN